MFAGHAMLLAYSITLSTEVAVISFFRVRPQHQAILAAVLINSLTHPLLVGYGVYIFATPLLVAEVLIFAIEAVWYRVALHQSFRRAITISFAANCASLCVGFFVSEFFVH